ncbi:hypothetical protein C8J57DRAFT_1229526 [Mycena rebaudengoi]|nr:hypothetical protein C8J57DRAFT_1229526 [Mycena rebaudengoi]
MVPFYPLLVFLIYLSCLLVLEIHRKRKQSNFLPLAPWAALPSHKCPVQGQSQLAEKARIRMAKHREKVKADPALAEDYRKRAQEASSVHRQRFAAHNPCGQPAYTPYSEVSRGEGVAAIGRSSKRWQQDLRNYEEEVALYREIRADEKWQQSRWGMAAARKSHGNRRLRL